MKVTAIIKKPGQIKSGHIALSGKTMQKKPFYRLYREE
jgi:hypothetical protein